MQPRFNQRLQACAQGAMSHKPSLLSLAPALAPASQLVCLLPYSVCIASPNHLSSILHSHSNQILVGKQQICRFLYLHDPVLQFFVLVHPNYCHICLWRCGCLEPRSHVYPQFGDCDQWIICIKYGIRFDCYWCCSRWCTRRKPCSRCNRHCWYCGCLVSNTLWTSRRSILPRRAFRSEWRKDRQILSGYMGQFEYGVRYRDQAHNLHIWRICALIRYKK